MFQVKVFNAKGDLKEIIPPEEVIRISNEAFAAKSGVHKSRMKDKKYTCIACKSVFTSNGTRGAKYCETCRPKAYKQKRKEYSQNKNEKNTNIP